MYYTHKRQKQGIQSKSASGDTEQKQREKGRSFTCHFFYCFLSSWNEACDPLWLSRHISHFLVWFCVNSFLPLFPFFHHDPSNQRQISANTTVTTPAPGHCLPFLINRDSRCCHTDTRTHAHLNKRVVVVVFLCLIYCRPATFWAVLSLASTAFQHMSRFELSLNWERREEKTEFQDRQDGLFWRSRPAVIDGLTPSRIIIAYSLWLSNPRLWGAEFLFRFAPDGCRNSSKFYRLVSPPPTYAKPWFYLLLLAVLSMKAI